MALAGDSLLRWEHVLPSFVATFQLWYGVPSLIYPIQIPTKRAFLLACLCIILGAPTLARIIAVKAAPVKAEQQVRDTTAQLPVFFITNREVIRSKNSVDYGVKRAMQPEFGLCKLINPPAGPRDRNFGWETQPLLFTASTQGLRVRTERAETFFSALHEVRLKAHDQRVVLFVPGYACSFAQAVERGAKLSHATNLPVVVFSWPSKNKLYAYEMDECTAEWSSCEFCDVLRQMDREFGNDKVILIAHSMGSRIVNWALERRLAEDGSPGRRYNQIFFCSPDIDAGVFRNSVAMLAKSCRDVRIFVSRKNFRLGLSAMLHGSVRLGTSRANLPEFAGLHVIDVTDIDDSPFGHSIPYGSLAQAIAESDAVKVQASALPTDNH